MIPLSCLTGPMNMSDSFLWKVFTQALCTTDRVRCIVYCYRDCWDRAYSFQDPGERSLARSVDISIEWIVSEIRKLLQRCLATVWQVLRWDSNCRNSLRNPFWQKLRGVALLDVWFFYVSMIWTKTVCWQHDREQHFTDLRFSSKLT